MYNKKAINKINKAVADLDLKIKSLEKKKKEEKVLSEIHKGTLKMFNSKGQNVFKNIYLSMRKAGKSANVSNEVTLKLVSRSFKERRQILKSLETLLNELKRTKPEFFQDNERILVGAEEEEKSCGDKDKKYA